MSIEQRKENEMVVSLVQLAKADGLSIEGALLRFPLLMKRSADVAGVWDCIGQDASQNRQRVYAARYEWLRLNPAFDTEAALSGLSPEEFDAAVDAARGFA